MGKMSKEQENQLDVFNMWLQETDDTAYARLYRYFMALRFEYTKPYWEKAKDDKYNPTEEDKETIMGVAFVIENLVQGLYQSFEQMRTIKELYQWSKNFLYKANTVKGTPKMFKVIAQRWYREFNDVIEGKINLFTQEMRDLLVISTPDDKRVPKIMRAVHKAVTNE